VSDAAQVSVGGSVGSFVGKLVVPDTGKVG